MQEEIYVTQEDMFSGVRHRGNFALDRLEAKEYFPKETLATAIFIKFYRYYPAMECRGFMERVGLTGSGKRESGRHRNSFVDLQGTPGRLNRKEP